MNKERFTDKDKNLLSSLTDSFVFELRDLVTTEREETMMSMPTERVMRALRRTSNWNSEEIWFKELLSWFRPVFIAGLLVIVTLAFYNVQLLSEENEFEQTAAEMVLGLPPMTMASAYDITLEDHH